MSNSARALIGVRLEHDEIFKKTTVKAFAHDRPPTMKFDPETGQKLWTEEEHCVLLKKDKRYTLGCALGEVKPIEKLGGLYLFNDRNGWGRGSELYFLGDFAVETESKPDSWRGTEGNFVPLASTLDVGREVDRIRDHVKEVLEPHGLWRPQNFGLWVVYYASC